MFNNIALQLRAAELKFQNSTQKKYSIKKKYIDKVNKKFEKTLAFFLMGCSALIVFTEIEDKPLVVLSLSFSIIIPILINKKYPKVNLYLSLCFSLHLLFFVCFIITVYYEDDEVDEKIQMITFFFIFMIILGALFLLRYYVNIKIQNRYYILTILSIFFFFIYFFVLLSYGNLPNTFVYAFSVILSIVLGITTTFA